MKKETESERILKLEIKNKEAWNKSLKTNIVKYKEVIASNTKTIDENKIIITGLRAALEKLK